MFLNIKIVKRRINGHNEPNPQHRGPLANVPVDIAVHILLMPEHMKRCIKGNVIHRGCIRAGKSVEIELKCILIRCLAAADAGET